MQISFTVTAKLISAFAFATRIVQSLFLLNPKFQTSSHLLWLYSPVCVGPYRKPRRPVFSQGCSNTVNTAQLIFAFLLTRTAGFLYIYLVTSCQLSLFHISLATVAHLSVTTNFWVSWSSLKVLCPTKQDCLTKLQGRNVKN